MNLFTKNKIFYVFLLFILTIFIFPAKIHAREFRNSFITIVNPVRISSYTKNPAQSFKAEYDEVKKRNLPATWLLTYDVIMNESLLKVASSMDSNQEFGIFLEVTENFSKNSGVMYNKTNSWHHAKALFLSGYKQEDRKKLIDKVFSEFKSKFGNYPKSVGGWWVDSFSLSHMKEKYGITGVLGISDQFDLDNYQVWGTPFSIPFYPSRIHAGIPAQDSSKLDIVTFRWAARDPLNGYISPSNKQASLYSVQDYSQVETSDPDSYFEKLIELYSVRSNYNQFGHITIGLEADYSPDIYEAILEKRLDIVKKFEAKGVGVLTMRQFSDWYRNEFPETMPPHFIETDDLLGAPKKAMWYQSTFYRIGLVYDYNSRKLRIVDLHPYLNNFQEPFYLSPNKQFNLSINLPYIIDSLNDKNSVREYSVGNLEHIEREGRNIKVKFEEGSIVFRENEILTEGISVPDIVKSREFDTPPRGLVFSDLSFNIPFAIKSRISEFYPLLILGVLIIGAILYLKRKHIRKFYPVILIIIVISIGSYILVKADTKYYISQSEIDGLSVLSKLPKGRVLVYEKDCLRCIFETPYKPAAAGGIKSYIKRLSGQETLIDFSFSIANTSQDARKILGNKDVYYVYLVKHEDYIEHLPYLPQDLGLTKVYENANIEIWKVN
ncbi:MAG: hypothetical protein HY427_01020 [Candidatus Levybacteria bacterium]|nr:hypothetical protein [Candidatus Levybacteria bacterium]